MAWTAPLGAADRRQQQAQEEQHLIARLKKDDPQDQYHYKVLRGRFSSTDYPHYRGALFSQAREGWELIAKLDDRRLILRRLRLPGRPVAHLARDPDPDSYIDHDQYQYKLLRGYFSLCRNRDHLGQILHREAHAGWEMVEKLDDKRLLFRRELFMAERDLLLGEEYDPYRTQVTGNPDAILVLGLVILIGMLLLGFLGLLISLLMS